MVLNIQDPTSLNSPSLHEAILISSIEAIRGGGAFAFVSPVGIALLLRDEIFVDFMNAGSFDLVVGIDDITTDIALNQLNTLTQEVAGLQVRVFCHELGRAATFHPKFCWFRHEHGGVLIVGSGNLTAKGLRGNWEAFSINKLGEKEINRLEQAWLAWTNFQTARLKPPTDHGALQRAALNRVIRRVIPPVVAGEPAELVEANPPAEADDIAGLPTPADRVLIAEIPRGDVRWNQANFDLATFRTFFGAEPGHTQRILLQHVGPDGLLGDLESRPSVSVRSHNYRFELAAAAGLAYPARGRPIAVFLEVGPRSFRYRLLMPGDPAYRQIADFANHNWAGRADRLPRMIIDAQRLGEIWPNCPLFTAHT